MAFQKELLKKKINFFNQFRYLKIINIGRLTDQKDHITLIKALNLLKKEGIKFKLYLIGQGNNYNKINNLVNKYKLTNNIKLAGFKEKAYEYINSADLFILTSKYEGLPNVLLEAQYLNKYIISTNCPTGPSEILLNGRAGDLFDVGDYRKLASIINKYKLNKKNISIKIRTGSKSFRRFDYFENCYKYYKFVSKNF